MSGAVPFVVPAFALGWAVLTSLCSQPALQVLLLLPASTTTMCGIGLVVIWGPRPGQAERTGQAKSNKLAKRPANSAAQGQSDGQATNEDESVMEAEAELRRAVGAFVAQVVEASIRRRGPDAHRALHLRLRPQHSTQVSAAASTPWGEAWYSGALLAMRGFQPQPILQSLQGLRQQQELQQLKEQFPALPAHSPLSGAPRAMGLVFNGEIFGGPLDPASASPTASDSAANDSAALFRRISSSWAGVPGALESNGPVGSDGEEAQLAQGLIEALSQVRGPYAALGLVASSPSPLPPWALPMPSSSPPQATQPSESERWEMEAAGVRFLFGRDPIGRRSLVQGSLASLRLTRRTAATTVSNQSSSVSQAGEFEAKNTEDAVEVRAVEVEVIAEWAGVEAWGVTVASTTLADACHPWAELSLALRSALRRYLPGGASEEGLELSVAWRWEEIDPSALHTLDLARPSPPVSSYRGPPLSLSYHPQPPSNASPALSATTPLSRQPNVASSLPATSASAGEDSSPSSSSSILRQLSRGEGLVEPPAEVRSLSVAEMDQLRRPHVEALLAALRNSVACRVRHTGLRGSREALGSGELSGRASVGILFSGGLDSAVLAALVDRVLPPGEEIDLLTVAYGDTEAQLASAPDRLTALQTYQDLLELGKGRKWNLVLINVAKAEQDALRPRVMELMAPSETVMDHSIASPLWFAARGRGVLHQPTAQAPQVYVSQAKVLLLGAGADEQFSGYSRHRVTFGRSGWRGLQAELDVELQRLWRRNLGRDDRVTADHGREARFPFLDELVVATVASIPLWMICDLSPAAPPGVGDKRLLRLVAEGLGLRVASRLPKRAIQFGSRIVKTQPRGAPLVSIRV